MRPKEHKRPEHRSYRIGSAPQEGEHPAPDRGQCLCHGSRFGPDGSIAHGNIVHGPAAQPSERRDIRCGRGSDGGRSRPAAEPRSSHGPRP